MRDPVKSYAKEAARVACDYTGIALCGTEFPIIELRRDRQFSDNAQKSHNLLFVIPTPEEIAMVNNEEFEHPQLIELEWTERVHKDGTRVCLPIIPGPFGDYHWHMHPRQDSSPTAVKGLGFNAGTEYMRWFFADELLDKMLLDADKVAHCGAPLDDLYTSSEHFYVKWCAEHPGRKPDLNVEYLAQRSDAVESGRTKLRAYILLNEVQRSLASGLVRKGAVQAFPPVPPTKALDPAVAAKVEAKLEQQDVEMEVASASASVPKASSIVKGLIQTYDKKLRFVEPVNRPPGMPPMMPYPKPGSIPTAQTPAGGSVSGSSQPVIVQEAEVLDVWDMPLETVPAEEDPDLEELRRGDT